MIKQSKSLFIIIFKEDQQLPFEIEKNNEFSNKLQSIVLSLTNSNIVNYLSDKQKCYLHDEITGKLNFSVAQKFLKKKEQKITNFVPNFVLESNSLKTNKSNFNYNLVLDEKELMKTIFKEAENQKNNLVVLIYDGCNLEDLAQSNIRIMNKLMQQFLQNFTNYKERYEIWNEYKQFLQHYSTSSNHAFYCDLEELKDVKQSYDQSVDVKCQHNSKQLLSNEKFQNELNPKKSTSFYLLASSIRFEQPQIIRLVQKGILKYFDPKFAIIASSNLLFKENDSVQQLECELQNNIDQKGETVVGLLWQEQFVQCTGKLFNHANYFEFGNQNIRIDSIFNISCVKISKPSFMYLLVGISQLIYSRVCQNEIFHYKQNFGLFD